MRTYSNNTTAPKSFSVQYAARAAARKIAAPQEARLHPTTCQRSAMGAAAPRDLVGNNSTTVRSDLSLQRCLVAAERKARQQEWVSRHAPPPLNATDAKRSLQHLLVASIDYHHRHSSPHLHATIYDTVGKTRPETLADVPVAYSGLHPTLIGLLFRDFDLIIERGGIRLALAAATEALPLWHLAAPSPPGHCSSSATLESSLQSNPLSGLPRVDRS